MCEGSMCAGWLLMYHNAAIEWPLSLLLAHSYNQHQVASCNGRNHHVCKWSLCANGWGRNTTTVSCCWWQPLQAQGAKVRVQGAKVRTSISPSQSGIQQQHANPTTTTTDQLRISTSAAGVHDAAIFVTCVWAHNSNSFHALPPMQVAMIAASCTPPAPVLIRTHAASV